MLTTLTAKSRERKKFEFLHFPLYHQQNGTANLTNKPGFAEAFQLGPEKRRKFFQGTYNDSPISELEFTV